MLNIISCAYFPSVYTLQMSAHVFPRFIIGFFLQFPFESSLYVIRYKSFAGCVFANIFSQSLASLFIILLTEFFTEQKSLIFEVQFINFFLLRILLLVSFLKILYLAPVVKTSFKKLFLSLIIFESIYFKLICV